MTTWLGGIDLGEAGLLLVACLLTVWGAGRRARAVCQVAVLRRTRRQLSRYNAPPGTRKCATVSANRTAAGSGNRGVSGALL